MAKREGVEIDGLFLRGLAAPLDYVQPGWERELGEGKKAKPGKKASPKLKAEMPGVMRVLPSGLGQHRMTGRSILGQAGGLGLGDEVHRLLERIEWGGLDPSWQENVPSEAWRSGLTSTPVMVRSIPSRVRSRLTRRARTPRIDSETRTNRREDIKFGGR